MNEGDVHGETRPSLGGANPLVWRIARGDPDTAICIVEHQGQWAPSLWHEEAASREDETIDRRRGIAMIPVDSSGEPLYHEMTLGRTRTGGRREGATPEVGCVGDLAIAGASRARRWMRGSSPGTVLAGARPAELEILKGIGFSAGPFFLRAHHDAIALLGLALRINALR